MLTKVDMQKLEIAISKYSTSKSSSEFGWDCPSLNIIDCVLSLNRHYERFTKPRVQKFKDNNPNCTTIENLLGLISTYDSEKEFGVKELNYNHPERIRIIKELCEYILLEISTTKNELKQIQKCKKWAISARPGDSYFLGIKGFGLAGFQYLRMLFGAQTTKPDIHIKRFVSEILDKDVSDIQALYCLDKIASKLNLPLTEIDHKIWTERSRNK